MIIQKILDSVVSAWNLIIPPLASLLYGLVLVLVGWIVARLLQWIVSYVLKALQLDKGAQAIGLTPILAKGEIKRALSDLLADLAYWVAIIITVVATADFLGLGSVGGMVNRIIAYLPGVLAAAVVLGIALFLASVVAGLIVLVAANIGISFSKTIARVIYYAMVTFAFVTALVLLGVPVKEILSRGDLIFGMAGLAIAIAFGLGCKDMAADFVTNLFKQK